MNVLTAQRRYGIEVDEAGKSLHPALLRAGVFWATWVALVACLMAARGIYLAWNWDLLHKFPAAKLLSALAIGLRFDASAAGFLCVVLLPIALVPLAVNTSRQRWNVYAGLLLALTLPLLVLTIADSELVRAVGRRTATSSLFLYGESDWRVSGIVRQFTALVVAGLALASVWTFLVLRGRRWVIDAEARTTLPRADSASSLIWSAGLLLVSAAVLTIAIRGGLTNAKPLGVVHTHPEPQLDNLALSTPFVLIKSLNSDKLPRMRFFANRRELLAHMNGAPIAPPLLQGSATATPPNVVVLVMESLSLGYMGEINGVPGYTPFLDELTHRSLFFPNAWANAMRSMEGIPAVIGGVPALGKEPLLGSSYAATQFAGLGTVLAQRGYDLAFFHAANRGSMYLDQFAARAGFTHYYAREDYPNPKDDDGAWGTFDEPYFQHVAQRIEQMRQPFGVVVFSLTAHHPFKVPPELADQFPDGPLPILKTIAYSDYALRRFFATVQTRPWFANTLFVITGDHGFLPYLPKYDNDLGRWRVPLILYQPGRTWPKADLRQPVAQIDIVPTIADLIGAPQGAHNLLAKSAFEPGERTVVLRRENSLFVVGAEHFLFYPLNGEAPQLYRIEDPGRQSPLSGREDIREHLTRRAQASLQYFNDGLLAGTLLEPAASSPLPGAANQPSDHGLEDASRAHAGADAHRHHPVLLLAPAQAVHQSGSADRAGGAKRMAERNSAP